MRNVKAALVSDFLNTDKIKVSVEGIDVLIVKIDGEYYAVANKCTHMGGSLFDGEIKDGHIVVCPRHHAEFDLKTGNAVKGAKMLLMNINVKNIKTYPVSVEGEDILVGMKD